MTIQEIQQAIRQLSRFQRENLAEWILNSADFADHVAEAALAYGDPPEPRRLTVDEYLRAEELGQIRHEYVGGLIFAMSGASRPHNLITGEVFRLVSNHLGNGPCQAYVVDMKVRFRVGKDEILYYPDVLVACGPQNVETHYTENPCLIVEVLSPSTQRHDRREKAFNYREIASLEEYVLIAQARQQAEIYRRSENWIPVVLTAPQDIVEFRSIGLSITLEQVYAKAAEIMTTSPT